MTIKKIIINLLIFSVLFISGEKSFATQEQLSEEASDYFELAKSYTEAGEYRKAFDYIQMMEAVFSMNEESLQLKKMLVKKLNISTTQQEAKTVFDNNNYDISGQMSGTSPSLGKFTHSRAEKYAKDGVEAYKKGEFDLSLDYFNKSKEIENNAIINNNIGIVYKTKQNLPEAIKYFEKSSKLDREYIAPVLNLALTYKSLKDTEKELYYLEKAMNIDSNQYGVYYLLGDYYYSQMKYSNAANYYYKSVQLNEDFFGGYYALAATLYALDDYDNALKTLDQAKMINENSDKLFFAYALIYIKKQDYPKAVYYIENALVINPADEYTKTLADVYFCMKNYQKAEELYRSVIANPLQGELYNNIGLCLYKLNSPQKALEFFEKAVNENPEKAIFKYNLSVCYAALNKKSQSRKFKEDAFKIKPVTEQDFIDLSCMYMDQRKAEKALEIIEAAIEYFPASKRLYQTKLQYYQSQNNTDAFERTKEFYKQKFGIN